jgi:hypothetical protein
LAGVAYGQLSEKSVFRRPVSGKLPRLELPCPDPMI